MTPAALQQAMDASWPAATTAVLGPWCLRQGAGGGKRVSAATVAAAWAESDIAAAEAAMQAKGQRPLFLIGAEDSALDTALAARGYQLVDSVMAYAVPVDRVAQVPVFKTFAHWPPLEIAVNIWAEAGIGPARLAIMQRAAGAKTAILSRVADRPAGVAFVACAGTIAMLHALEVRPEFRRQGSAQNILACAADWAAKNGADRLALVVTTANQPARALYASQGMQVVGHYHYRMT